MVSNMSRTLDPSTDFALSTAAAVSMTASHPRPAQFGSRSPYLARHGCRNLAISLFNAPSGSASYTCAGEATKKNLSPNRSHRAEHGNVLKARQHDHVQTKLLHVIGRRER